jgi:squalene-hopene/tetraprenyl-beta-curcumene cyclase
MTCFATVLLLCVMFGAAPPVVRHGVEDPPLTLGLRVRTQEAVARALAYLIASRGEDGGWEAFGRSHPAITSLVVNCLVQDSDYGPKHPAARRGLDFIVRYVQPDGGIYAPGEGMRNYHTSVALMALAATKDLRYAGTIKGAQRFLTKLQWDDGEGHEASSPYYGGQGYGKRKRPDLSNTQLMLEALHQSGLATDDPVFRKAMVFVSRCQMLDRTNDQPFANGSEEGGFVYTPVGGGESKAGTKIVDGQPRLRSYGSMTYAGFKSMLYARVDRDDVRVRRAIGWIRRYYTLDHNPNMPGAQSKQGLYYYYHVFARAMQAWGEEILPDAEGVPHRWRAELCRKLLSLQREDGSWVNDQDRWYEGNPHLVTAYAVLALQTALLQ